MKKRIAIIIIVVAIFIVIGVILTVLFGNGSSPQVSGGGGTGSLPAPIAESPSSTPAPSGNTITIGTSEGSVIMKNFYNEAEAINPSTVFLHIDDNPSSTAHYGMGYNRADSQFYITIDAYSLSDAIAYRGAAEKNLLSALGISEADACKLNVSLKVNPTYAAVGNYPSDFTQINYGLSFCPNGIAF